MPLSHQLLQIQATPESIFEVGSKSIDANFLSGDISSYNLPLIAILRGEPEIMHKVTSGVGCYSYLPEAISNIYSKDGSCLPDFTFWLTQLSKKNDIDTFEFILSEYG